MDKSMRKGSKVILIGLVGSMGSWKTEVSNFLHYSHGFVRVNFEDKVKEVANVIGKTDMQSLRAIRHAMRECLGKDVWIRLLEKRIEEELFSRLVESYSIPGVAEVRSVLRIVVGDIRYRNELDFVRRRKGLLIGLKAEEKTLYERSKKKIGAPSYEQFKDTWLKHPSELEIPPLIEKCDFIIDTNNMPLHEVEAKVDKMIKRYYRRNQG